MLNLKQLNYYFQKENHLIQKNKNTENILLKVLNLYTLVENFLRKKDLFNNYNYKKSKIL